jgi:hypothetical protein
MKGSGWGTLPSSWLPRGGGDMGSVILYVRVHTVWIKQNKKTIKPQKKWIGVRVRVLRHCIAPSTGIKTFDGQHPKRSQPSTLLFTFCILLQPIRHHLAGATPSQRSSKRDLFCSFLLVAAFHTGCEVNLIQNYVPQLQSIHYVCRQLTVAQALCHVNSINVIDTQLVARPIAAFLVVATLRGVNVTIREVNPIRNYIPWLQSIYFICRQLTVAQALRHAN